MNAESPAEYILELQRQNKILRANVLQLVSEKQAYDKRLAAVEHELRLAQQAYMRLRNESRHVFDLSDVH